MIRLGLLLVALALCGCGQQGPSPARDPAPRAGVRAVAPSFDATARAFVELTIATDDQAVKLMDLGASRAASPALRDFAAGLASSRRTELAALHDILGTAGIRYVDHHAGHDMPGMPTEAELVALAAAADFDAQFRRLARAHLTESTTVAESGLTSIEDERTKAAAATMAGERAESLRILDAMP